PISMAESLSSTNFSSPRDQFQSQLRLLVGASLLDRFVNSEHASKSSEAGFVGWNVVESKLTSGSEASLPAYQADSISAWCWSLAVLGISVTSWLNKQIRWIPAAVTFLTTLAVVASAPWSLLAAAAATGLAAGGMWLLFSRRGSSSALWLIRQRSTAPP